MPKQPVAILGASGTVGQKMIALLEHHPLFYVEEIVGSDNRVGAAYGETVAWRDGTPCPDVVSKKKFSATDQIRSRYILSALPNDVASDIEPALRHKGHIIISNAAAHRMDDSVSLIVPEINGHLLPTVSEGEGALVTNPNCVVSIVSLPLMPLFNLAPIDHVGLTTLQAASGAGYPGVPSMDLLNNILPNIPEEEEKIAEELQKVFQGAAFPLTVQVNRVPIRHGHMISVQLAYKRPVGIAEAVRALEKWSKDQGDVLVLHHDSNHPQPALHLNNNSMAVHVGRMSQGGAPHIIRFVVLGHNLIRGAAGAAIQNLEAIAAA